VSTPGTLLNYYQYLLGLVLVSSMSSVVGRLHHQLPGTPEVCIC